MSIVVTGFIDLEKGNDDMSISPYKKKKILREAAEYAKKKVEDASPVRSGELEKSWKIRNTKVNGNQAVRLYSGARHDIYNELGSSRNRAHIGFFSGEIDAQFDTITDMMIRGVTNK